MNGKMKRFVWTLSVAVLCGIAFGADGDRPKLSVDCAFPGGNVKVCGIDDEAGMVSLDTDSRGDSDWFWSYFRVSGAAGRKIGFVFRKEAELQKRISRMGMLCSLDDGKTWAWTAPAGDQTNAFAFCFDFPATAKRVRFATSYPYTKADLDAFVSSVPAGTTFRREILTTSRKGRPVDLLRLGDDPRAEWSLVLSARHHACESPASYVLEGFLLEMTDRTSAGTWLRRHVHLVAVPFVDADGVEEGDQGKGRRPHDHNRDYVREIYPEVRAFKRLVRAEAETRKVVFFDLHAPTVRGTDERPRHDNVFTLGPYGEQAPRWDAYRERLVEQTKDEPIRYLAQWDEPWMVDYNVPPKDPTLLQSRLWAQTVSNVYLSSCWEIPFGRCGGVFTPEAARRFGRSMARTLVDELKPVTPSVPRTSSNAVSR